MEREERVRRWERLMDGVRLFNVKVWRDSFVAELVASRNVAPVSEQPMLTRLELDEREDHGGRETGAISGQNETSAGRRNPAARPRPPIQAPCASSSRNMTRPACTTT